MWRALISCSPNDVAIERARNRLKAGIGGMDSYMELVQEIRTAG